MINKINPIDEYPNIVAATIRDMTEDDDERDLIQKIDRNKENWSVCLFAEDIKKKINNDEYRIVLRFDFSDKDEFGNPVLDLEVFKNGIKTTEFKRSHHTVKENDIYTLKIDNFLELELELKITATDNVACFTDLEHPKQ